MIYGKSDFPREKLTPIAETIGRDIQHPHDQRAFADWEGAAAGYVPFVEHVSDDTERN